MLGGCGQLLRLLDHGQKNPVLDPLDHDKLRLGGGISTKDWSTKLSLVTLEARPLASFWSTLAGSTESLDGLAVPIALEIGILDATDCFTGC